MGVALGSIRYKVHTYLRAGYAGIFITRRWSDDRGTALRGCIPNGAVFPT